MTGKRGCPKGTIKRKPEEVRKLILDELARGNRSQAQLRDNLQLAKTVAFNHVRRLLLDRKIHIAGEWKNPKGGVNGYLYGLGAKPRKVKPLVVKPDPLTEAFFGVRTQIRGNWPTAETVQRARSTKDLITASRG